jgi:3'(2'), 5'-bisphosphate nucleotidase
MNTNLPFTAFDETKLAIDAIKKASKSIMEIYHSDFSTSTKNDNEPITEADIQSNKIILDSLAKSGYPILSEESPDDIQKRLGSNKVWIVDPLDGTTDFVNKTGEFTVMIALVEEHFPVLGVISCPSLNALYLAQKGKGAYFTINNDSWQKLAVSKTSDIQNCKVVGSRFHQSEKERQFMNSLDISKFTSKGSSLKALDISSGNADLYFTFTSKMKHWDTCASYCIVSESGGKITDMLGNDIRYNTEEIHHKNGLLVTNGIIHGDITKRFEQFQKA